MRINDSLNMIDMGKDLVRGQADPQTKGVQKNIRRSLTILLVEDNAINKMAAVLVLEKAGHVVTDASNGLKALEAFEKKPFDLILMDINMPVMDGYEATTEIRRIEKSTGLHVPIIAVTALETEDDRQKCLELGMDDFISKPWRAKSLIEMLDKYAMPRVMP